MSDQLVNILPNKKIYTFHGITVDVRVQNSKGFTYISFIAPAEDPNTIFCIDFCNCRHFEL